MSVQGQDLLHQLYIPEPFLSEQRDVIDARRITNWRLARSGSGTDALGTHPLILMIAELKEIAPARYGHRAIIKHLPDLFLPIDDKLYRGMSTRFASELSLWGLSPSVRIVLIATIGSSSTGIPLLNEISLMSVTGEWLPFASAYDLQLTETLIQDHRSFLKPLRYNLAQDPLTPTALLMDAAETPVQLHITLTGESPDAQIDDGPPTSTWRWNPLHAETMPELPPITPNPGGA